MTYVSARIARLRPEYAGELAQVLEQPVVAVVEIDNLRPQLDTLVITARDVLAVLHDLVIEDGSAVVTVPLAEVAGFGVQGRSRKLALRRTDGGEVALGNLEDASADLDALLAAARSTVSPSPVVRDGVEQQLAQLERIATMHAAGELSDEQADAMRRRVLDSGSDSSDR